VRCAFKRAKRKVGDSSAIGHLNRGIVFERWFAGSVVTDPAGCPLLTYRGEHGKIEEAHFSQSEPYFQSRLGSLSFGSAAAASTYALTPNVTHESAISPRISSAYLSIKNPVINRPDDPYIELDEISQALGKKSAIEIAWRFQDYITHTNNWCDNIGVYFPDFECYANSDKFSLSDLYFSAHAIFDEAEYTALFGDAGFDGAIHGGSGATFGQPEYKVFSGNQIWLKFANVPYQEKLAR
jgi:hypothetical protein